jgi:hypothetical protein
MLMLLCRSQMCRHIAGGCDQLGRVLDVIGPQRDSSLPNLCNQWILNRLVGLEQRHRAIQRARFRPLHRFLRLTSPTMSGASRAKSMSSSGDVLSLRAGASNAGAIVDLVSSGNMLLASFETGTAE